MQVGDDHRHGCSHGTQYGCYPDWGVSEDFGPHKGHVFAVDRKQEILVKEFPDELQGDIERVADVFERTKAEKAVTEAIQSTEYTVIETCIETCKKWNSTPSTHTLINHAYDRLIELKPENAAQISNEKYEDLPYMGMKRYLKNNGVDDGEVDSVPGPYYKYELDKVATNAFHVGCSPCRAFLLLVLLRMTCHANRVARMCELVCD